MYIYIYSFFLFPSEEIATTISSASTILLSSCCYTTLDFLLAPVSELNIFECGDLKVAKREKVQGGGRWLD